MMSKSFSGKTQIEEVVLSVRFALSLQKPGHWMIHSASGLVSPDHPCWDDYVETRWPLIRIPRVDGPVDAFDEVLDLRQHLVIPHGLGRLVDVHIMARRKCVTAPDSASTVVVASAVQSPA
jgi:hypothetical protein